MGQGGQTEAHGSHPQKGEGNAPGERRGHRSDNAGDETPKVTERQRLLEEHRPVARSCEKPGVSAGFT